MSDYQTYRKLNWTTDHDDCENYCGKTLSEGRYIAGGLGHYCSAECMQEVEGGPDFDFRVDERKQMGISR